RLQLASTDEPYVALVTRLAESLAAEEQAPAALAEAETLRRNGDRVAYFCAEFGLTEVLPIYSGGLGVLAGDHLKAAHDLGVPLVGVGLFYRQGFFRQALGADSKQLESYPLLNPDDLPMDLLATPQGVPPLVSVRLGNRDLHLLVRRVKIGRIPLLLLDSNLPVNRPSDRDITARLYSGDSELRIQQEIVLGVGGLKALDLAGLRSTVRHANEGHAAFLGLERIRQIRAEMGVTFDEALEMARAGNVFTTHTPVPAGIDIFGPELMKRYFENEMEGLGITFERFLGLGRQVPEDPNEHFSMAVLGLRLSASVNGVSKLHATVSRRMWKGVFPDEPISEIPIAGITNGVHAATWTEPGIASLALPTAETPDREGLWKRHEALRAGLVAAARERTALARRRRGAPDSEIAASYGLLDPKALTISFARRFATYKRATLIFHDLERLAKILGNAERPVQLLFAGKAHPKDVPGKEFLKRVGHFAQRPELLGRVVLLEDYDMALARQLVSGSDVWLNNPRRPHEASGTSGMKAAMNGILNLSVLDGWWDEAPQDEMGFSIGDDAEGHGDEEIAGQLYERLENDVVPLFYDRATREATPEAWVTRMISAAKHATNLFSAGRMVTDYVRTFYLPAAERRRALAADGALRAKDLAAWKQSIAERWSELGFVAVNISVPSPGRLAPGEAFDVEAHVRLGTIEPDELAVDWFEGRLDPEGVVPTGYSTPFTFIERNDGHAVYRARVVRPAEDRGYSVRIRPTHRDLAFPNETGLVVWAG
ncbi:MAG: alpha-glucan family phosphorylase, partial [Acidobacteria bacterium]|nr:alpha-glucan family phosphorylase [Acidobacteriota bacterium]